MNNKRLEFINGLKGELGDLPYNEVDRIISFFEESIEDKLEEGMSEDEIFIEYGSYKDVAKEVRIESNLESNKKDKKDEKTGNYEADERVLTEYIFDKSYPNIKISDKDLKLIIKNSEDDKIHLKVFESSNHKYSIDESEDLVIKIDEKNESWLDKIIGNIFVQNNYYTELSLPICSLDTNLYAKNKNGKIILSDLAIKHVDIKNKNGVVNISVIKAEEILVENLNGKITVDTCSANKINLKSINGKIEAFDSSSNDINTICTNGAIVFNEIVCGYINLENTNGKIEANNISSKSDIFLKNSMGKITFKNTTFENNMQVVNYMGKIEGGLNHKEEEISFKFSNSGSSYLNNESIKGDKKVGDGSKMFEADTKAGSIKIYTNK